MRYLFLLLLFLFQESRGQSFYQFYKIEEAHKNYAFHMTNQDYFKALYWADYVQNVETSKSEIDSVSFVSLIDEIRLYHQLGMYENAQEYVDKLNTLSSKINRPKKNNQKLINYSFVFSHGLAIRHYLYLSQVDKAERYAIKLEKSLATLTTNTKEYGAVFTNLSSYFIAIGAFQKADSLLQNYFPENNLLTLDSSKVGSDELEAIKAYGDLYFALKNRKKAKEFYTYALENYQNRYDFHVEVVQILLRLGEIALQEKLFLESEKYFNKSLDIISTKVGKIHRLYAIALSLMAQSQDLSGGYDKNATNKYHIESLKIFTILKKENGLDYALSFQRWLYHKLFINPNAKLNFELTQVEIERKINRTTRTIERELKKESLEAILAVGQKGIWYFQNGDPNKGRDELMSSNERLVKKIYQQTAFLTETEQIDLIAFLEDRFSYTYSYSLHYAHLFPELGGVLFNNFLILKGLLVNSRNILLKGLNQVADGTEANKMFDKLTDNQEKLSRLLTKEKKPSVQKIEELQKIIESEQKELRRLVPGFSLLTNAFNKGWEAIRDTLQTNEIVVDFIHFKLFDVESRSKTNAIIYCALLLKQGYNFPKVVPLFKEDQLQQLIASNQLSTSEFVSKLYEGRGAGKKVSAKPVSNAKPPSTVQKKPSKPTKAVKLNGAKKPQQPIAKPDSILASTPAEWVVIRDPNAIYNLIWAPIDSACAGIERVYIIPSGLLHTLSFAAIQKDSKLLLDRYELVQLSNARQVLNGDIQTIKKEDGIVLFGGIDYNSKTKANAKEVSLAQPNTAKTKLTGKDISVNYLPATKTEVELIGKLFVQPQIYIDDKATEAIFKSLSGKSAKVLHLATHGLFADSTFISELDLTEDQRQLAYFNSTDPLIRSVLMLAGANMAFKKESNIMEGEDGILTAYELANLDLSNTRLVVLSACGTGLGDISNTEGVFGLQRALKMAGVEQYIISLWDVPDAETQELMTLFYNKLVTGTTIQESFTFAQREMRKKHSPYYWAAFVLVR